jgi:hypothetical protein
VVPAGDTAGSADEGQRELTGGTVLILTHPEDVHANAVQEHLDAEGVQVYRTDTALLGTEIPVTADLRGGRLTGNLGDCDLATVTCVWHRRPSEFAVVDPDEAAELRAGIGGVLATLPHLNHPADMAAAGLKPRQLVAAARCGLNVPDSRVSSVRAAGAAMADGHNKQIVVKAVCHQTGTIVQRGDLRGLERRMFLVQQLVEKQFDVRVTVVDEQLFGTRIRSPYLDWRIHEEACRYDPWPVPTEVEAGIHQLMAELRLRYAALDFAVDHDGRWWYLETNPNGQWLWIEHHTGQQVAAAIARALARPPDGTP